ncbi:MAG TPA: rod shape-determining protein MreD [Clostridia bacterium]|nr:rod shape-determining protein MreD [Clostridia bacterium]
MNRKLLGLLCILVCIYLDSVFFARINILGIRPDAMLAAVVSFAVHTGSAAGAGLGAAGGLLLDVLFGRSLGLYTAIYLCAGFGAGYFYKKFYADNVIIPAAFAAALGVVKELLLALIVRLGGVSYSFLNVLGRYILPSALLSGLLCALFHVILKPLTMPQIKRRQVVLRR